MPNGPNMPIMPKPIMPKAYWAYYAHYAHCPLSPFPGWRHGASLFFAPTPPANALISVKSPAQSAPTPNNIVHLYQFSRKVHQPQRHNPTTTHTPHEQSP